MNKEDNPVLNDILDHVVNNKPPKPIPDTSSISESVTASVLNQPKLYILCIFPYIFSIKMGCKQKAISYDI